MRGLVLSQTGGYPGVFQEIAQLVGDEAAAKLAEQYGGVRLYIPAKLTAKHPLRELLGQEIAQQLCGKFAGLTVEIPRGHMQQIARRNRLIMADRAAGMSQRERALKYHLTERTICKIAKTNHNTN